MRLQYRDAIIEVVEGDITAQKADAIVNPANRRLVMGGGVAGAIKRAGGEEIEREAVSKGPIEIGEAIATGAGRLAARYVIHAPTVKTPGGRATLGSARAATRAALKKADELGLKSIALPGMGTGVGGLSLYEAVRAMAEEVKAHLDRGSSLEKIILVAYGRNAYEEFARAVSDVFKVS
ncbi:MAG TPA: macro domain-containing protein [Candidatus Korarchaeota archaeon]|nr:macro domain-containing protein [Candidatus Korarchaeota archaeon]